MMTGDPSPVDRVIVRADGQAPRSAEPARPDDRQRDHQPFPGCSASWRCRRLHRMSVRVQIPTRRPSPSTTGR
jgi:hypothetical protein